MKSIKWQAYSSLAWTEPIICPPEKCREEVEHYSRLLEKHAAIPLQALLHPGCGAGLYDHTFKQHYRVTGIDISKGMLKIAAGLNPEVRYFCSDMRTFKSPELYDAVIIPDSIGYMLKLTDLQQAIKIGYNHLKPGGVFLIVAHVREEFTENNFVYTGAKDGISITIFENNTILDPERNKYEAVFTYLIRRAGKIQIAHDRHLIGLFPRQTWLDELDKTGMQVIQERADDLYVQNVMEEGDYSMTIFIGKKSGEL